MIKDLINFCWFIFKWGIVPGTILALVAALYIGPRVDEEIRAQIERKFAEQYPGLKITIRSAARVQGQGIEVRDLSIFEPGMEDPQVALVHVEKILLQCDSDLADLIGEVCIKHVTVRRPTLRLTRLPNGTWVGRNLWSLPKISKSPPDATIENGIIEIIDRSKNPPSTMTFRDVNLTAKNQTSTNSDGLGLPNQIMQGSLTGDHLGRIDIAGHGHPDQLDWQVTGTVHDLKITPELRRVLPTPLAEQLNSLTNFRGRAMLNFDARADAKCGCRFNVTGQITEGRLDDPRLPSPWADIRGSIKADNQGITIENLFAQSDRSTLWVSRCRHDFGCPIPCSVKAKVTQFAFDQRLRAFLPESMRISWDKYQPAGEVDMNLDLVSNGHQIDLARSKIIVNCRDVAFVYHKFPYPMHHGKGTLKMENDVLAIDMDAASGNRPIEMSGQIKHPLTGPCGWFEAKGQNIPIDEKVRAALVNEKTRRVFDLLAPGGLCDFWLRAWRDRPDEEFYRHVVINAKDCKIRFGNFPYPLEKITGRLERLGDGTWEFSKLRGLNDTAQIRLDGRLFDGPDGKQLILALGGDNVRLDRDLHDALKPSMQQAWDNLEPSGVIDLQANIKWLVESKKLDMVVIARPQPKTASIKPKMFPYRMNELSGTLVYRDGKVNFEQFRAKHGRTEISGRGRWNFSHAGGWDFHLDNLAVQRLRPDDRDLLQALPSRLRDGILRLHPTGHMYLRDSKLSVYYSLTGGPPMRIHWDIQLGLQPGSIDCGISVENARGEVHLCGMSDGEKFNCEGELNLESLTYKKLQFTEVRGPISFDGERVFLGSWVAQQQRRPNGAPLRPPQAISGKLCEGTVKADAMIAPRQTPCYALRAELLGADLACFAREIIPGKQNLKGRVGLSINLEGYAPTINGLRGRGQLWLRDGDVYELPLMIRLVKMLKMGEPDTTAFSEALVRFNIAGNHIYLKPIKFDGGAITLVGQGEMDFQSNIDLAFYAMAGRNRWYVPLVSPIVGEASRQTMTIKAHGTLQNPQISRDVLPGVKEALRELEASLQGSPAVIPLRPVAGQPATHPRPAPLRR